MAAKINKALRHLFYINSFGQTDGSGLMWMEKNEKTNFIKAPLPSPTFMEMKCFDSIKSTLAEKKFVAGHTRYSTVGSNSWENSHPFEFGNFMGMQNGTISNKHKNLFSEEVSPCEVDSASVFWSFDKQGVKNTLDRYEGEGVFMFFNKVQGSFNIVKNHHRTLHQAKIATLDAYLFATDQFVLELVAERSNLKLEDVKAVEDDKLITFTSDGKIVKNEMKVPGPKPISYNSYYYGGYGGSFDRDESYYNRSYYNPNTKSTGTNLTANTNNNKKVTSINGNTAVVKNLPAKVQKEVYIDDCDFCGSPITTHSVAYGDSTSYDKSGYISCKSCKKNFEDLTLSPVYRLNLEGV